MVDIEIDDKKLEVEPGSMIIEAADAAGIRIPRFCYHKKLSVAANCRMCLVEVEKVPKPVPACATPVTAGMKVYTCSDKARDAQRAVMEFLLINHPLDCPICDQGGECELQDNSLGYGQDISRFNEGKRVVKDKNIGPLVATDMTRCIHCTRCVRFGYEIAGMRELGTIGRGETMQISTFVEHSLVSELSGNIIDLCPVGALTSKPFRFTARAWELKQYPTIAPHDCIGSNLYAHTRRQEVMRIVPRENEAINETWISDRDRFSYTALKSPERLTKPMIKLEGQWEETDWQTALQYTVGGLQHMINDHGPEQLGAIASPGATLEEGYLLQKLWRTMGSNNIDHRIHQTDFADQVQAPAYYGLSFSLQALEKASAILLIGANIGREQPMLNHRVRKAFLQGAKVACVNSVDYPFNFQLEQKHLCHPNQLEAYLAGVAKALTANAAIMPEWQALLAGVTPSAEQQRLAEFLQQNKGAMILLGALAMNHPRAAALRSLACLIAELGAARIGFLTEGANSAGAFLAGVLPHRTAASVNAASPGLDAQQMFARGLKAYLLLGIEPELDLANSGIALSALQAAEFVAVLSPYKASAYLEYADVILPIAAFTETSGTYVNAAGEWQSFNGAVPPLGEARPAWKVLRVLANIFEFKGFEYNASEEVRDELHNLVKVMPHIHNEQTYLPDSIKTEDASLVRLNEWPIYRVDSTVRRAEPLQQSATADAATITIAPDLAASLGLKEGEQAVVQQEMVEITLPVIIDARIGSHLAVIPSGFPETAPLRQAHGPIAIRRLA